MIDFKIFFFSIIWLYKYILLKKVKVAVIMYIYELSEDFKDWNKQKILFKFKEI